jgi:transcription termination/antitermination protein NusA
VPADERTITQDDIQALALFENVTHARAKDFVKLDDRIVFVVEPGQLNKALGPQARSLHKLKDLFERPVDIVEFADDSAEFLRNIFHHYQVSDVTFSQKGERKHATVTVNPEDKGRAIGKGGRNLKVAQMLASRHTDIQSVSVA